MKVIQVRFEEQIESTHKMVEYRAVSEFDPLPSKLRVEFLNHHFDSKEIAQAFTDIGEKLLKMTMGKNIKDVKIESSIRNNPVKQGKELLISLCFEEGEAQ